MYKFQFILLIFFIQSYSSFLFWKEAKLKNPMTDSKYCKVSKIQKSYLCDPDKLLSTDSKRLISASLNEIKLNTPKRCISPDSKAASGLILGVAVISSVSSYKYDCEIAESQEKCLVRNVMNDWFRKSCEYHALILIKGNSGSIASVHFGNRAYQTFSRTCILRVKKEVEEVLTSSFKIENVFNRIYMYLTDPNSCMIGEKDDYTKMKTELLVGLIVGSTIAFILLVFLVSYMCRRKVPSHNAERRNSNIVRPLNVLSKHEPSELPPVYSDIVFTVDSTQPPMIVVEAAPGSTDPPSYSQVIRSPLFTQS